MMKKMNKEKPESSSGDPKPSPESQIKKESSSPPSQVLQFEPKKIDEANSEINKKNEEEKVSIGSGNGEKREGVESSDNACGRNEQESNLEINETYEEKFENILDGESEIEDSAGLDHLRACLVNFPNIETMTPREICRAAITTITETREIEQKNIKEIKKITLQNKILVEQINSLMGDMETKCPKQLEEIGKDIRSLNIPQRQGEGVESGNRGSSPGSETKTESSGGSTSDVPLSEAPKNKSEGGDNLKRNKMDDGEDIEVCANDNKCDERDEKNDNILEHDNSDQKRIEKEIIEGFGNISINEKKNEESAGDIENMDQRQSILDLEEKNEEMKLIHFIDNLMRIQDKSE